jgi:hypothetical protein
MINILNSSYIIVENDDITTNKFYYTDYCHHSVSNFLLLTF